jgi:hypothetical protein
MNTNQVIARARTIAAINATNALDHAMPDGLLANEALDTLNLALDNIDNPTVRRLLAGRVERAGHDLSSRRGSV